MEAKGIELSSWRRREAGGRETGGPPGVIVENWRANGNSGIQRQLSRFLELRKRCSRLGNVEDFHEGLTFFLRFLRCLLFKKKDWNRSKRREQRKKESQTVICGLLASHEQQ